MNPERMAKILKRVESRKQRALAREQRSLRRAGLQTSKTLETQKSWTTSHVSSPETQKARVVTQTKGGCGGCRKKAEQFKAKMAELKTEQTDGQRVMPIQQKPLQSPPQKPLPDLKSSMNKTSGLHHHV